jgi:inner membrane protein
VEEREGYRRAAEDEVIGLWGGEQTVAGPFLVVPYTTRHKDEDGKVAEATELAFFLPAELRLEGSFEPLVFTGWRVAPQDIRWEEAYLAL